MLCAMNVAPQPALSIAPAYIGVECDENSEFGVKTLYESRILLVNECTQYDTDNSFKVVLGSDNVVTHTHYNTGKCQGEASETSISGPLEKVLGSWSPHCLLYSCSGQSFRQKSHGWIDHLDDGNVRLIYCYGLKYIRYDLHLKTKPFLNEETWKSSSFAK